ncbi:MAG: hypothetical protein V3T56_02715 [Gemmatimonadales bacterium]
MARRLVLLIAAAVLGCSSNPESEPLVQPQTQPLPAATFAGRKVAVFPVTYMVAQEDLGWNEALGGREDRMLRADSLFEEFLLERVPEVDWVFPEALRRAADRAPGMLRDPDRIGAAVLRDPAIEKVPDPLISNMRNLVGLVGDRMALVPAGVIFGEPTDTTLDGGMVELTVSVVDVRQKTVVWYGRAYGVADDPWEALRIALDEFLPIRP